MYNMYVYCYNDNSFILSWTQSIQLQQTGFECIIDSTEFSSDVRCLFILSVSTFKKHQIQIKIKKLIAKTCGCLRTSTFWHKPDKEFFGLET